MMPKRRRTRAHNTAKAIAAERRLNETYAAATSEPNRRTSTRSNDRSPALARYHEATAKRRHSPGTPLSS